MSTISVVLPVRNGARWIGEALTSVVGQTRPPDEIIVVDGQSQDDSAAIAARYPGVRVLRQPDLGVGAGLSLGFAQATGDLVTIISCDDRWRPDKLALQSGYLASDPSLDVVFGHVCFFLDEADDPPASLRQELLCGSHPGHLLEIMMIRRELALRVGPFRADLAIATDVDWFARLAETGARTAMPEAVMADKRLHAGSNAADTARNQAELFTALRDAIGRRRSSAHG